MRMTERHSRFKRRVAQIAALLIPICLWVPQTWATSSQTTDRVFDSGPWIEDFQQLLLEMSGHYANLEWALRDRRMDLPRLRADTEEALRNAHSLADVRRICEYFIDAFGDGHLVIDWPNEDTESPTSTKSAPLCERLGYRPRGKAGLDYSLLPGLSPLSDRELLFPGGLWKVSDKKTFGLVRIGVFTEKGYPAACQEAAQKLGMANNSPCDDACADKIALSAANILTTKLLEEAEELRRAGANALLLDITRNGGGSDWADAPPRALSSKPLRDPRLSFVKSTHWTNQLGESLKNVESDLRAQRGPSDALQNAAAVLKQAIVAS